VKYHLLVEEDGDVHVIGEVSDEFGIRWAPLRDDEEQKALAEIRTILGYGAAS
jgi:hypothetical protein